MIRACKAAGRAVGSSVCLRGVFLGLCAFPGGVMAAQASSAAPPSVFTSLALAPAPSQIRLASGAPGPTYWQNRADYDLHATLDTVTGTIVGEMTLRYTNHSPDTLPVLWFQTEQNAFWERDDPPGVHRYGDVIDHFTEVVEGTSVAVQLEEHQTETRAILPRPLRPGETATFHVGWHCVVPPRATDPATVMGDIPRALLSLRMGRDGTLYRIAQWYPRVNVYDDVKGWNTEPYTGAREFYLEYGDYTLAVTVPATYLVAATGTLDNPKEVLTATQIARLTQAARSDTTIPIVTAAELADGRAHRKHAGTVTWRFHAKNVRDAVFAASPEYQWDATSWQGIVAQAYYRPATVARWHEAAAMARLSIQEYSERWFRYPYPQVSVVEAETPGPVTGGMEYPMLSFDATAGDAATVYSLFTHEIGHDWFPMLVGSNERAHPWMDEGFNTFMNAFSNARRFPARSQEARIDRPPHLRTIDVGGADEYDAPAYALELLRRDIVGPALFDSAFRTYIRRWAYKHPTPADFFRTMNDVSKQNLDWFWREWFEAAVVPPLDQALDSVQVTPARSGAHIQIVYGNRADAVAPLLVCFTFRDSTTQSVTYPVDIWRHGTTYAASYDFPGKIIARIEIDPAHHLWDGDRSNNRWTAP